MIDSEELPVQLWSAAEQSLVDQASIGTALTSFGAVLALAFFVLYVMRGAVILALAALVGTALVASGVTIIVINSNLKNASESAAAEVSSFTIATQPSHGHWIVGRWVEVGKSCEIRELSTEFLAGGRLMIYPEQGSWFVDKRTLVMNSPHRGRQTVSIRRIGEDRFSMTYPDGRRLTLRRCASAS